MNVVFFGTGPMGWDVFWHMVAMSVPAQLNYKVIGVVRHPEGEKMGGPKPEIRAWGQFSKIELPCYDAGSPQDANSPEFLSWLKDRQPALGVAAQFRFKLPKAVLDLFPLGIINVHTGYLPYNRGNYPNVWPIIDGTPAGVSLHYMDEGIDTGPVIARERVPVEPWDTGESLHRKLQGNGVELFRQQWGGVIGEGKLGRRVPAEVLTEAGTSHKRADVDALDALSLPVHASELTLLDTLRARTFPPYRGAWFEAKDSAGKVRRIGVRIMLSPLD